MSVTLLLVLAVLQVGTSHFEANLVGLCCRVVDRLKEPAGLWFEACGGWDHHQPAAAAWWAQHSQPAEEVLEKQMSCAEALPSTFKGWEDRKGMLYIQDSSPEDGEAAAPCRAVGKQQMQASPQVVAGLSISPACVSSSWRLPGHSWTARGDINGPPPRGTGDLLVGCPRA